MVRRVRGAAGGVLHLKKLLGLCFREITLEWGTRPHIWERRTSGITSESVSWSHLPVQHKVLEPVPFSFQN